MKRLIFSLLFLLAALLIFTDCSRKAKPVPQTSVTVKDSVVRRSVRTDTTVIRDTALPGANVIASFAPQQFAPYRYDTTPGGIVPRYRPFVITKADKAGIATVRIIGDTTGRVDVECEALGHVIRGFERIKASQDSMLVHQSRIEATVYQGRAAQISYWLTTIASGLIIILFVFLVYDQLKGRWRTSRR